MRSKRDGSRGQGLVELALVLPIFLTMLFGIVDLGRVVWANDSLANAAREAARFAIVHGGSDLTLCPVGPTAYMGNFTNPAGCPAWTPDPKEPVRAVGRNFAIAAGTGVAVDVCYGTGCTGNTDAAAASNKRGTPVTVTVRSTVPILTGSLLGFGNFTVSGASTMLVNN